MSGIFFIIFTFYFQPTERRNQHFMSGIFLLFLFFISVYIFIYIWHYYTVTKPLIFRLKLNKH